MLPLKWSRMESGNLNGKVGPVTLFTVNWHTGVRRWFVASKLPGLNRPIPATAESHGMMVAEECWRQYQKFLAGAIPWEEVR